MPIPRRRGGAAPPGSACPAPDRPDGRARTDGPDVEAALPAQRSARSDDAAVGGTDADLGAAQPPARHAIARRRGIGAGLNPIEHRPGRDDRALGGDPPPRLRRHGRRLPRARARARPASRSSSRSRSCTATSRATSAPSITSSTRRGSPRASPTRTSSRSRTSARSATTTHRDGVRRGVDLERLLDGGARSGTPGAGQRRPRNPRPDLRRSSRRAHRDRTRGPPLEHHPPRREGGERPRVEAGRREGRRLRHREGGPRRSTSPSRARRRERRR